MLTVDQGINHINELKSFDDEKLEILFKLLYRSGGTVFIPNATNPD